MGKARGRPPKPGGAVFPKTLQIRLTADEKAEWTKAAGNADSSLSEWIREKLNAIAERENRQADEGRRREGRS